MYRVEDKYLLPYTELWALEKRIASILEPDYNNVDGSGYSISSLYFDDYYDSCLIDTVDGVASRDKYRIRIYNNSFDVIKLEVKSKLNNRTLKHACTISEEEMRQLINGEALAIGSTNGNLEDPRNAFGMAIMTRGLRPRTIVTYERNAYIYEPGNVRITFDYNIRGSNIVERFGDAGLSHDHPDGIGAILEVKYDEFLPDFIAQLIENNYMLQTSNSKYRICSEMYRHVEV